MVYSCLEFWQRACRASYIVVLAVKVEAASDEEGRQLCLWPERRCTTTHSGILFGIILVLDSTYLTHYILKDEDPPNLYTL